MDKWYHVTNINRGSSFLFQPNIPGRLQKSEDRKTPRICITANWKYSLRSIIIIHLNRYFYVYSSFEKPVDPQIKRQELLNQKKIRMNSNDFRLPPDGIVNKEHWYLTSVQMSLEGHIQIPEDDYGAALMGLGMFNYPDVEKMKLIPGSPILKNSIHEIVLEGIRL